MLRVAALERVEESAAYRRDAQDQPEDGAWNAVDAARGLARSTSNTRWRTTAAALSGLTGSQIDQAARLPTAAGAPTGGSEDLRAVGETASAEASTTGATGCGELSIEDLLESLASGVAGQPSVRVGCPEGRASERLPKLSRSDRIAQDFLNWLADNNSYSPNPEDYLDRNPTIDGSAVDEDELERLVATVDALGLIKGMKAMGREMPLRARLTDEGLNCVMRYDGDLRRWESRGRGTSATYSTEVHAGRDAQVSSHSTATRQRQGGDRGEIDFSKLLSASRDLEGVLPALPEDARPEASEAIKGVRDAERASDEKSAKWWGEKLIDVVAPLAESISLLQHVARLLTDGLGR